MSVMRGTGVRGVPPAAALAAAILLVFAAPAGASAGSWQKVRAQPDQGTRSGIDRAPQEPQVGARIVGGSFTTTAEWPWQAAIVLDETFKLNDFDGHFCGGELIAPRIVTTAAHCVFDTDPDCTASPGGLGPCLSADEPPGSADEPPGDGTTALDPNDANALLGRTVLSGSGGSEHDLQAIYIHSGYDPDTAANDIALLVLTTPDQHTPIKLAGASERSLWLQGRPAFVVGWGSTSEGGSRSDTLKEAQIRILADSTCAGAGPVYAGYLNALMVCAGLPQGGTDACQGDSGSPLNSPGRGNPNRVFRLTGIVLFGEGCARAGKPGVYTEVSGAPIRRDLVLGLKEIESSEGLPDQGNIVGAACAGRTANLVGSGAADRIAGTARVDVIATVGGRDRARGLGGRDAICGGGGPDRLVGGGARDRIVGGPGNDRLIGGPGPDRLIGGGGNDICIGGPGRDRQKSC